jgi:predicted dehydrogenase
VDAYLPRFEIYADEPPWTPPPVNPSDPMAFWKSGQREVNVEPKKAWVMPQPAAETADVAYFLDCIEQGRESDMSVARAAEGIEALMAAYRSAATGQVIFL